VEEKYLNLFTDFGFKKIFGEEFNKDLLLDFLNELLKDREGKILDLTYLKNEHLSSSEADRKAIFDLYCENEKGEKFIVELQKTKQNFFKDRSVYYTTFPIQEQAKRGDWNYELKNVYTIGILDFTFEEDEKNIDKMIYYVKLSDVDTNKVFYDKLTFIYLEMPKFKKGPSQLKNHFERWLYVLKNLHKLKQIPSGFEKTLFGKLFEQAEISKLSLEERRSYEDSLKYYRDLKNSIDTALEEGEKIGLEKGEKIGLEIGLE
jgi:predicted transposase/invertase (TIGR01784 family)